MDMVYNLIMIRLKKGEIKSVDFPCKRNTIVMIQHTEYITCQIKKGRAMPPEVRPSNAVKQKNNLLNIMTSAWR